MLNSQTNPESIQEIPEPHTMIASAFFVWVYLRRLFTEE